MDNKDIDMTAESENKKKGFDRQWLIGLYDLIIYTAVFGITLLL
jgi:hypothetical protein